ncbi:DUF1990 domain-containing protein [Streptomyces sp. LB8]|uniref:DUF1990 domain-containing protein n=1 Tax=Streptomyces thermogriseus TaxID=75292 RepID=A0ABN1SU53_9ACTN|nr:DUF1990 domain-containing protein [Streptomyces sp. LB8]MDN5382140.1 DUF1990 domain-containing protein [Streptomyces sp. LB8]
MSEPRCPRVLAVLGRWLLGTVLVTWRYLWETTPLRRGGECRGDERDRPPPLSPDVVDDRLQQPEDGCGPLYHRLFRVNIAGADLEADRLITWVCRDFKHFVPTEVVDIHTGELRDHGLDVGDELLVEMPGPWNGPVRVVHRDAHSLRLATLRGHMEAGQVQFHARQEGDLLVFEIELWACPGSRLVHLLYSHLRLAKEIQLNMWVRFCLAAVKTSGGRLVGGVHISTRWLDPPGKAPARSLPRTGQSGRPEENPPARNGPRARHLAGVVREAGMRLDRRRRNGR